MKRPEMLRNPVDIVMGQRIRERREALGMSIGDVARAVGGQVGDHILYEEGQLRVPSGVLISLAHLFGVVPSHFFPENR